MLYCIHRTTGNSWSRFKNIERLIVTKPNRFDDVFTTSYQRIQWRMSLMKVRSTANGSREVKDNKIDIILEINFLKERHA